MRSPLPSLFGLTFLVMAASSHSVMAQFTSADIGNPAPAGTVAPAGNGYTVTAGGGDIGGVSDQFTFNYQTVTGDFDYKMRVDSLSQADTWTKAGLMARATLTSTSIFTATFASPSAAGAYFSYRQATGGSASNFGSFPVNYPNTWLRLQRAANSFTSYASFDGNSWVQLGSVNFTMTNTVFLGMAVASRTNGVPVTAQFRDFAAVGTNGTVVPYVPEVEPPGPSSRLTPFAFTEIMYNPSPSTNASGQPLEFVELYNSNPFFEDISGYRISGDIDFTFPPNTVLQGGAYLVVARDPAAVKSRYGLADFNGYTGVMGSYSNALPGTGTLRLRNKENAILLEVPYSSQPPWPAAADGAGHSLVLAHASYGERSPQAWAISDKVGGSPGGFDTITSSPQRAVVINEFLANSEAPDQDYIELYNHSNQGVDISGCTLSDDAKTNKFAIPAKTIPARGFVVFYQSELGFGLGSGGESIYFRSADGTRVLDAIRFDAQATGVSSGRSPDGAKEIYPLKNQTPALPNSAILIRDVVINEIMYNPISNVNDDEYIELYNKGTSGVNLGGWKFTSGISYTFSSNTMIAPGAYLVVAHNASRLLTNYPNLNSNNTYGDFKGSLRNKGDRLALTMPDINITTNTLGDVKTNLVHVVVDEVTYGTGGAWPTWPNEGGSSLELIDPRSNHRLAQNWAASDETQKAPWTTVEATGQMDNGSTDTPNWVEFSALGEGEYLVDNVEVLVGSNPANMLAPTDANFDSGLGAWRLRGTHIRSGFDAAGGLGGTGCLHVRSTARGDTMGNRTICSLTAALPLSGQVTLRAKVRWLRGWPECLLRVRGNWMEAFGPLSVPLNLGTPGLPNSRAVTNSPPAIYAVSHAPVVPAIDEPVVVTARADDPNGVAAVVLKYRPDGASYTSVPMRDDGSGGDAVAGDGIYTATIPAPGVATLYAFQVTAMDTLGASQIFPLQLPAYAQPFECLVRFGDPIIGSSFATYRQWMTESNLVEYLTRPPLSNEQLYETFIYGNFRAIYNANVKWAGSPYHQFSSASGVTNTSAHYAINLPADDLFLGTDSLHKIHAPGNGPFDDDSIQREQTCYWAARQIGLPWNYRRYVNMFFNGNRRGGTTRMMEDSVTPGGDLIDAYFPDDADGELYKLQPWFEQADPWTTTSDNRSWVTLLKYTTLSNGVPVHKTAHYRNNFLVRGADGTANNFQPVFDLVDAGNNTNNPSIQLNLDSVADMEQWCRIFAVEHASGNWDAVGSRNQQNMYGYKPKKGKWQLMIWDWNIVFGNSGSWGVGEQLTGYQYQGGPGPYDTTVNAIFLNPVLRRSYLRGLKEVANGPFAAQNVNPLLDAKYNAIVAGGVAPASPSAVKSWIASQRTAILNFLTNESASVFKLSTTNFIVSSNNLVLLTGEAPVDVKTITINGVAYPITWTTVKAFTIAVAVTSPTNDLVLQGYDLKGNPLPAVSTNVTFIFNGDLPAPETALVFNEIMYNPAVPDASFVEIYNNSNFAYDLSDWRVNGIDYTFPVGSVITNRHYLVLAKNRSGYASAFPGGSAAFGQFDGSLDNGGETLSLERPVTIITTNGAVLATNVLYTAVNRVRYDDDPPWPAGPDGYGPALQLIDASQDNSRVSNWTDQPVWRQVRVSGNFGSSTNVKAYILMNTPGSVYIDDVYLVTGSVAEAGENLIRNGDFESGLSGPWVVSTNNAGSVISATVAHSGTSSLQLFSGVGAVSPSTNNSISQDVLIPPTNQVCTLSFWFLPTTNANIVTIRTAPGSFLIASNSVRPILATPGTANSITKSLPAYDPLWLNELQPNNLTGPTDNNSQHDPWVELYNAGANTLDLSGYYLADNYTTNLTQWKFPAGASLAPHSFRLIWLDGQPGQSAGSELHANFRLNASTGAVALVRLVNNAPQITDYLNYAGIGPDLSYGSVPDGQPFYRNVLFSVTPGTNNIGRTINVFINEWMASNTNFLADPADLPSLHYDDWFELYNAGSDAVDLGGYWLTDNLNNHMQFQVPTNGQYVIPPHSFLLVWADGQENQNSPSQPDLHVSFNLNRAGESIGLYAPDGSTAIDTVSFGQQTNDISQGRFSDGAGTIYYMTTPTPRHPNTIGQGNTPPVLAGIPNQTVTLGQTVNFTASAIDADFPTQTLTYSLDAGFPAGANITGAGMFTWTPTPAQAPSVRQITVRVTDSGAPPLSATQTFTVTVHTPPKATISNSGTGQVNLTFDAINGKTYRVESKDHLDDSSWTPVGPNVVASGNSVSVSDDMSGSPQRFYRIVQLD